MLDIAELDRRFAAQQEFGGIERASGRPAPLVSVCVATYQHGRYIRQCLDGILMQRTSFPYEVVVGEDESTDGTREICIEYARQHPDRIRLFLRTRSTSIYTADGLTRYANGIWCRRSARGRYVALCEGDDYWICPDKLQKQVDLLESNPDCSMSFHNALFVEEGSQRPPRAAYTSDMRSFYDLADLLPWNWIYQASVMYRRDALPESLPEWYYRMPMFDWPTFILVASAGRLAFLPEVMSVYRIHPGGVWSQLPSCEMKQRSVRAAEILLEALPCRSKSVAHSRARLHRSLLETYLEGGDFRSASRHAGQLLRYALRYRLPDLRSLTREDAVQVCWWLSIVARYRSPRLWSALRRTVG